LYDAFNAIRADRLAEEFGDEALDPTMIAIIKDVQIEMGDVLDQMHLHNECCRARMLTQVEFKEVY
jgi:DNA-directed RNA polymerase subunit N (RpoN/RPB10)